MKKILITKGSKPATVVTIYYDSNVFEFLLPRPTKEKSDLLLQQISYAYANEHNESSTIYISRITKESKLNQFKLIHTDTNGTVFASTILKINPNDDLLNSSSKLSTQIVPDFDANGSKLPSEFNVNIQTLFKKNESSMLSTAKNGALSLIKKLDQPFLPTPELPSPPMKIYDTEQPGNLDEINRRFAPILKNSTITSLLAKIKNDQLELESAINKTLSTAIEPIQSVRSDIATLLANEDKGLDIYSQSNLKDFIESRTTTANNEFENKFRNLQINFDIVSTENKPEKFKLLLKKYQFGNGPEYMAYLNRMIAWSLHQAAADSMKMIWSELCGKDGRKKTSEFNQAFAGIATIDELLQITLDANTCNLLGNDTAHMQNFLQLLLSRNSICIDDSYFKLVRGYLKFVDGELSKIFDHSIFNPHMKQKCCFTDATIKDEMDVSKFQTNAITDIAAFIKPVDINMMALDIVNRHASETIIMLTSQYQTTLIQIEFYKKVLLERQRAEALTKIINESIGHFDTVRLVFDSKVASLQNNLPSLINHLGIRDKKDSLRSELSKQLNNIISDQQSLNTILSEKQTALLKASREINYLLQQLKTNNLSIDNNCSTQLTTLVNSATEAAKTENSVTDISALKDKLVSLELIFKIPTSCDTIISNLPVVKRDASFADNTSIDLKKNKENYLEKIASLQNGKNKIQDYRKCLQGNLPEIEKAVDAYINLAGIRIDADINALDKLHAQENIQLLCHLTVNAIFNLAHWHKMNSISFRKITVFSENIRYQIPTGIKPLMEIVTSELYDGWINNPDKSLALLTALRTYTENNTSLASNNKNTFSFYHTLSSQQDLVIPPANIDDVIKAQSALSRALPIAPQLISRDYFDQISFSKAKPQPQEPSANMQKPIDGFFKRHWKAITATTSSFAIAGAIGGGALGLLSVLPSFGLGVFITPVLAAIGFIVGGIAGFAAGCIGSLVVDAHSKKEPNNTKKITEENISQQTDSYTSTLRPLTKQNQSKAPVISTTTPVDESTDDIHLKPSLPSPQETNMPTTNNDDENMHGATYSP